MGSATAATFNVGTVALATVLDCTATVGAGTNASTLAVTGTIGATGGRFVLPAKAPATAKSTKATNDH